MQSYINEIVTLFVAGNGGFLRYDIPAYENINTLYIISAQVETSVNGYFASTFRIPPNSSHTIAGQKNEILKAPIYLIIDNPYNNDSYAYVIIKRYI